jgi:hypothetical protein
MILAHENIDCKDTAILGKNTTDIAPPLSIIAPIVKNYLIIGHRGWFRLPRNCKGLVNASLRLLTGQLFSYTLFYREPFDVSPRQLPLATRSIEKSKE